jgi:hypothetical protein
MIGLLYAPVTFPPQNEMKCPLHSRPGVPTTIPQNVLEFVC